MSDILRLRAERELDAAPAEALELRFGARLLTEARHLVRYVHLRYAPRLDGDNPVPGLADVGLDPETGPLIAFAIEEIERLNETIYAEGPRTTFPVPRAREVLGELREGLKWVALGDAALTAWVDSLRRIHRRTSAADLVSALSEYLRAARAAEPRLRAMRSFDAALLDEAETLVRAWVDRPDADRSARERRQKLAWVLREQMRRVVAAADYAFRRHPGLRRDARSERTNREREVAARTRKERREKAAAGGTTPEAPTPT
jgi:hypothetical protein